MRYSTRMMVATFGAFTGLMGIEHGVGEILQGNVPTPGLFIESWPGSEFLRILAGEPAFTLLPNLLAAGILACIWLAAGLPFSTWIRFFVWLALGLVIYFIYGYRNSVLHDQAEKA